MHVIFVSLTGIIYWERDGKGGSTIVYTSGWVVISDGITKDALPINMVSQEFVDKVGKNLEEWGYKA